MFQKLIKDSYFAACGTIAVGMLPFITAGQMLSNSVMQNVSGGICVLAMLVCAVRLVVCWRQPAKIATQSALQYVVRRWWFAYVLAICDAMAMIGHMKISDYSWIVLFFLVVGLVNGLDDYRSSQTPKP